MAYRALVGCASVFGGSRTSALPAEADSAAEREVSEGDAYAWFCIDLLLSAVAAPSTQAEHRKKLVRALVSTVSAVSLRILPRLLGEIETLLGDVSGPLPESGEGEGSDQDEERQEIVKALFEEVLSVGDEEKEFAIRWWGDWKARSRIKEGGIVGNYVGKGKGKEVVARL